MKGIILTGGSGTRLSPLTIPTNKHLLPVYNKPMVYHAIELLVNSGITDILIVCGGNSASDFLRVLGNGEEFGLKHLHYRYQSQPRGIADALGLAEEWAGDDPVALLLGDNIFENTFENVVKDFEKNPVGAIIFGTHVKHPEQYGVIVQDENGKVLQIVEKPKNPTSDLIATGLYFYDSTVWDFIKQLSPSSRGELEITDVNSHFLQKGQLKIVELQGKWMDCGECIDGYLEAQNVMAEIIKKRQL
jgi:glucose-1-phosphate thymidylyltransferase